MSQPTSYEQRPARKVRAISIHDANDVVEYPSISAAAKAIEGQVSQRNVRALITRTVMKSEPLLGRKWVVVEEEGASVPSVNAMVPEVPRIPVPGANLDTIRVEEIALKRQQLAVKEKQMDLLIRYIDTVKDKSDPFVLMLMKQFLAL
jgi:hypothetical protein